MSIEDRAVLADRLDRITQAVGFTLWQIQELEGVVATYLVLVTKARPGMSEAEARQQLLDAKAKTLGNTIRLCVEAGLFESLQGRFKALLNERNWLVHRSRADSRAAVHGDVSMSALLARLEAIADAATELLHEVSALAEEFTHVRGDNAAEINRKAQQILEQWRAGNPSPW